VTVVVGLVALSGLLDVVLGTAVAIGSRVTDVPPDDAALVGVAAAALLVLGLAQLAQAVLLMRGSNVARLVVTLVLVLRQPTPGTSSPT
jgi:hypothetical protein